MIYTPRSQSIEAAPVELAGQRLMAVAVDGKAHLVDAGVFETLFEQRMSVENIASALAAVAHDAITPTHVVVRPTRKSAKVSKPAAPATAGQPAERKLSDVMLSCIRTLEIHGPLTSAELRGHVYHGIDPRKQLQNFSALSITMQRKKLIERRTDPRTQLDKWHIVEASDGKL